MVTEREGTGSNEISKHGGNDSNDMEMTSDSEVVGQEGSARSIDELDEEARMERIVDSDQSARPLAACICNQCGGLCGPAESLEGYMECS